MLQMHVGPKIFSFSIRYNGLANILANISHTIETCWISNNCCLPGIDYQRSGY